MSATLSPYTLSSTFWRGWAAALVVLVCLSWAQPAQAQQGQIRLFAPTKTYTPGNPVTVYAYFFRVRRANWSSAIRDNGGFRLKRDSKKRISGVAENIPDQDGFPQRKLHLFYRFQLLPIGQQNTLSYSVKASFRSFGFGGFRRYSLKSNVLRFRRVTKAKSNQTGTISTKVEIPTQTIFENQAFTLTYTINCAVSVCDYRGNKQDIALRLLQPRIRLGRSSDFFIPERKIRPDITNSTTNTAPTVIKLRYKMYAQKSGSLQVPSLSLSLPVLKVLDQRTVLQKVYRWLRGQNISAADAPRLVSVNDPNFAQASFRRVSFVRRAVKVKASFGVQGDWQLQSRLVKNQGQLYWKISLTGRGLLRLAANFFRKQLSKELEDKKLTDKIKLAHLTWELIDRRIDGRVGLHAYFSFNQGPFPLPSLQMQFLDKQGKKYTRTTQASTSSAAQEDSIPLSPSPKQRHVYIHTPAALTASQPQQLTIYGYKLPEKFPLGLMLRQKLKLAGPLSVQERSVGQVVVSRRRVINTPFGRSESFYQGPENVNAQVATIQASLRNDIMAQIPSIRWGGDWYFSVLKQKASRQVIKLVANTDRKKYFAGESVVYTLSLRFSKEEVNQRLRTFIKDKVIGELKLVKLPDLSQFSNLKVEERFKLYTVDKEQLEFRYKVRFKAPQADRLQIKPATIRLSNRVLLYIARRFETCMFPDGGNGKVLFKMIALDHHNQQTQDQGCDVGTQVLTSAAVDQPIVALPDQAKQLQLIGNFRVSSQLTQMSFPNKNSTIVDKPFYWVVDIAGDGDLSTARDLLKDQLSQLLNKLRKQNVTGYIETPDDKELAKQGKIRLQVQLIGEEVGGFKLPSLKLKYYHREEGVLTAQTLPIDIKIVPRTGGVAIAPTKRKALPKTQSKRVVQQTTDLRPNLVLGAGALADQSFGLDNPLSLLVLLSGPLFFLLFLGWHQMDRSRQADPQRNQRNKALGQFVQQIKGASFGEPKEGARQCIDALQRYLIDRLSLQKKLLTPSDIEEVLSETEQAQEASKPVVKALQQLEASMYGGAAIDDPKAFVNTFEQNVRALDRALPKGRAQKA